MNASAQDLTGAGRRRGRGGAHAQMAGAAVMHDIAACRRPHAIRVTRTEGFKRPLAEN
jgi:hypothetical protein